jgi:hypothetical protein
MEKSHIKSYKPEQSFILYHEEDPDLPVIKIPLPKAPEDKTLIDGYGLAPHKQKFKHEKMPHKLKELAASCEFIHEIYDTLQAQQFYYKEEIEWIKKQWHRLLHGYWLYINGRPTYIDGWHYAYCNFWELDSGLPDYRERDYKFFHFARFCYNDDKCLGFNYPKHRREGATSKASCIHYFVIILLKRSFGGIQSMTDTHASIVFTRHIVAPWKSPFMPFFFKPNYSGTTDPQNKLIFNLSAKRVGGKGSPLVKGEELGSGITFEASNPGAYDSQKLHFFHDDEVGKLVHHDINERHAITKKCLSQGQGKIIHGFTIKTSTVGDMEKGGGKNFLKLCKNSNYAKRNENGQTISGLYTLFIPAEEGLDGFVDEFGGSVIEDPKTPIRGINGELITQGSRSFLRNQRKALLDAKDYDGYGEEIRQVPIKFRECFTPSRKDSGFNINKLNIRYENLLMDPSKLCKRGNFEWLANQPDTRVVFIPDPNGRFELSYDLPDAQTNRKRFNTQIGGWEPMNTDAFVAGGDPFKFRKTQGGRKSNGGGAVWLKWDSIVDNDKKPYHEWKSGRFVCVYDYRPDSDDATGEYAEDMLKMCIYFGCKINPEINIVLLWDHFVDRGYSGFLHYMVRPDGSLNSNPGVNMSEAVKQKIFKNFMDYVENHIDREHHIGLIEQIRDIGGPQDLTDFDLFAAAGLARLADEQKYREIENYNKATITLDQYVETFDY